MFFNLSKTIFSLVVTSLFVTDIYSMDPMEEARKESDLFVCTMYTQDTAKIDFYTKNEENSLATIKYKNGKLSITNLEFDFGKDMKFRGKKLDNFEALHCFLSSFISNIPSVWGFDIYTKDGKIVIAPDRIITPIRGVFAFKTNGSIFIQNEITFEKLFICANSMKGADQLIGNIIRVPYTADICYDENAEYTMETSTNNDEAIAAILQEEENNRFIQSQQENISNNTLDDEELAATLQKDEEPIEHRQQENEENVPISTNNEVALPHQEERVGMDGAKDALQQIWQGNVGAGTEHLVRAVANCGEVKKWKKKLGFK